MNIQNLIPKKSYDDDSGFITLKSGDLDEVLEFGSRNNPHIPTGTFTLPKTSSALWEAVALLSGLMSEAYSDSVIKISVG